MISAHRLFTSAHAVDRAGSLCLYGAGSTGRRVLEVIRRAGGRVRCFLDTAASRLREVSGVPVRAPFSKLLQRREGRFPVVLAIFNRDVDTVSVARRLARHGYGQIVSYPDFHGLHREALGEHFWLGDPALVGSESGAIEAVDLLWADERSRSVFRALVGLYESRDPQRAPRPSRRAEEYFAQDIPGWPPATPVRLVDCGAYDGDTLERFRASRVPMKAAACFEPDPENFILLEKRLAGWPAARRRGIELWPFGVADRSGTYEFESGRGESSRLGEFAAGSNIACVSLDEALPLFAPNLVKLDVEGAEEPALRGAAGLIREHRPGLAVSVYHRPADLWRIPALIDGWGLGYRLFLRSYGFSGFDTICYAVPRPGRRRAGPAPTRGRRTRAL